MPVTSAMGSTDSAAAGSIAERDVERDLSLPEALELACNALRNERYDDARLLFAAMLEQWPEQADALHFLGITEHRLGRTDEGVALIHRATQAQPQSALPWNNLGNVLVEASRIGEALQAYEQALAREPALAEAHNNVGTILCKQQRWVEAEAACRRATELQPGEPNGWYNLSRALIAQNRVTDGVQAASKAITLWPRHTQGRDSVARALVVLGELGKAAELYREWLAEEPDNPIVAHHLAACTGQTAPEGTPKRASDRYVEQVFDSFSATFDAKLQSLNYAAPQLVADALRELLPAPDGQLDIADVGCGTGLVGPLVRPWARRLAGCDLSVGMLRKAKARGVYDVLHKAELVHYLQTQAEAFDVIVSADTLCYFGDLSAAMSAARHALRPGGWLVFTVEALPADAGEPYRLQPHGRYAHHSTHLQSVPSGAGLRVHHIEPVALRMEAGAPVGGWLVSTCTSAGA
jgi:predicted TPR repeat methyltransferase